MLLQAHHDAEHGMHQQLASGFPATGRTLSSETRHFAVQKPTWKPTGILARGEHILPPVYMLHCKHNDPPHGECRERWAQVGNQRMEADGKLALQVLPGFIPFPPQGCS
jgi:hypothetical protein